MKEKQIRWPKIDKKPSAAEVVIAIRTLIKYIGDDPDRPGLVDTPLRVIKAWKNDWGLGYDHNFIRVQKKSILGGQFDDGAESYDTMICVRKIAFTSHCEHHLAEFGGLVDIAYIPKTKILGLSKLVRVVNMFSKRLQVQERLTTQIANFIEEHCDPIGVGVIVRAKHSCMCSRGVRQSDTEAVTSALRGEIYEKPEVRDEFLRLVYK